MDTTRFKHSSNDVPHIAVLLEHPNGAPHLHTGIVFRDAAGQCKRLDFGWYKKLNFDNCPADIGCAVPGFDPADEQFLALYCGRIARTYPSKKIPYNLKIDDDVQFTTTGDIEFGASYTGLSCATFVAAVFRSAGNPLIDTNGWPEATEEDREIQERFVAYMRQRHVDEERAHAEVIAAEIGGPRIAPEDVAGACLEDVRPVSHALCAEAGRYVIAAIDGPHPQPPAPHTPAPA